MGLAIATTVTKSTHAPGCLFWQCLALLPWQPASLWQHSLVSTWHSFSRFHSCVCTIDIHIAFTNIRLTQNHCHGVCQHLWGITKELGDGSSSNLSGVLSESEKLLSRTRNFHCEVGLYSKKGGTAEAAQRVKQKMTQRGREGGKKKGKGRRKEEGDTERERESARACTHTHRERYVHRQTKRQHTTCT